MSDDGADDRVQALAWAEHLRTVRATVLDDLAAGRATPAEVLARRSEPALAPMYLLAILEACPGIRKIDARRSLDRLRLAPRVAVGELDDATVERVLGELTR